jgi:hypothetical protein
MSNCMNISGGKEMVQVILEGLSKIFQANRFLMEADFDAELCSVCKTYYVHMRRDNMAKCNHCAGCGGHED